VSKPLERTSHPGPRATGARGVIWARIDALEKGHTIPYARSRLLVDEDGSSLLAKPATATNGDQLGPIHFVRFLSFYAMACLTGG
jgi:hypothetical protein